GIITGAEHSFASVTKAYPNPVTGKVVFIQHPVSPQPIAIKLFNGHGDLIHQFNAGRNETSSSINVDGLAGGVYLLRIETRDEAFSEKIVVVR
ncbi:MAG TPA: T9SS type A sorting domain-containing protein, partial [Chryseolinea sp.]